MKVTIWANKKDVVPQLIMGLIMFQQRPTSIRRADTTQVYPKRAVKRAMQEIDWIK